MTNLTTYKSGLRYYFSTGMVLIFIGIAFTMGFLVGKLRANTYQYGTEYTYSDYPVVLEI
ncbi:hypothetical protein JJE66_33840 [Bradyrhizobium diazoefficiens]|uniref:hypothetical protein n=1 Tax=Bradyrhizobium diazoefficiens TaxID=1355477 RepID=UPI00190A77C9|nr:hypothetical protein [Bradyrhizobium diazoefficiens]MBK3666191.1 hypothetical protein [Bradyrhizobium diazoefficiens]